MEHIDKCLTCTRADCPGYCPSRRIWNRGKTWGKRYGGRTIREWSQETGIGWNTLYMRLVVYGWDLDRAVKTPARRWGGA